MAARVAAAIVAVALESEKALQHHGESIGRYRDRRSTSEVVFMGMLYRFECVAPRSYRHRVGAPELFLEPGLFYVTD